MLQLVAIVVALVTVACARPSAPKTVAVTPEAWTPGLGPLVPVGQGGEDGFMTVDGRGVVHVIMGGRYRSGPAPDHLGPAETVTAGPFHTARMTADARGVVHVVYTAGAYGKATTSWYTSRAVGVWTAPEKFADAADFPERTRAYVADVAVDADGNALVGFWVSRPQERRSKMDDPAFHYRWRQRDGSWTAPRSLASHWSSTPKVEHVPGQGFFLLWQRRDTDWRVAGPAQAGDVFSDEGRASGSASLQGLSNIQNEGADFAFSALGDLAVAGNVRALFTGPVGVWVGRGSAKGRDALEARYLGSFPGTTRGQESGVHPVVAWDAATGDLVLVVRNPADETAMFAYHRRADGWWPGTLQGTPYRPLLPEARAPQGTTRQGPSVADVSGPGVLTLVRDGDQRWYLRRIE